MIGDIPQAGSTVSKKTFLFKETFFLLTSFFIDTVWAYRSLLSPGLRLIMRSRLIVGRSALLEYRCRVVQTLSLPLTLCLDSSLKTELFGCQRAQMTLWLSRRVYMSAHLFWEAPTRYCLYHLLEVFHWNS